MSLLKAIKAQLGLSNTPANNFTITAEADNGSLKLARGNAGATTQDILTVDASGNVNAPVGIQKAGSVLQALSDFTGSNVSRAVNGYQRLPSGLIIQWSFISLAANTSSLLNFPIAFPTAGLAIVGSRRADGSNVSYNFSINSTTQLRAQNTAGGHETAHYIAIGY